MFEVIIFDLCGVLTENKPVFHIFKDITNYKGTVRSIHARIYADYVKVTLGDIKEVVSGKRLKKCREPEGMKKTLGEVS